MPPRKVAKKKSTKRKVIEEEVSEGLQDDDELLNMENANMPGMDQEDLTQEEKDEVMYKKLTSYNPQAPPNNVKFSFCKDRGFKTDDVVDQLVFHYQVDGDILLQESDEARDQQDYKDNKATKDKQMLNKMNVEIIGAFGQDSRK